MAGLAKSSVSIRLANESDAADVRAIFAPYVKDTSYTLEEEVPTVDEMREQIRKKHPYHVWLVAEESKKVIGYCCSSYYRPKPGYRWTAALTIYLSNSCQRRKIGTALYEVMLKTLDDMGYYNVVAIQNVENSSSIRLHEKFGFKHVSCLNNIGFKNGAWSSLSTMLLKLKNTEGQPEPIRSVQEVVQSDSWKEMVLEAEKLILPSNS